MRKITLFLMSLFLTVGAMAQITTNTSTYTIKSVNRGYIYYDHASQKLFSSSFQNLIDAKPSGATNEQFAFLRTDNTPTDEYYIYCIDAKKFVTYTGTNGVALDLTSEPVMTWKLEANDNYFVIKVPNQGNLCINITNWNAVNGCKVISTGADEGNKMTLTERQTTYNSTDGVNAILAKEKISELAKKYTSIEVYTINNAINNRGTLAYGKYNNNEYFGLSNITLSGYTNNGVAVENDANKYWCIAKTEKGAYIYNIGKGLFLQDYAAVSATCSQNVVNTFTTEAKTENGTEYTCIKSGGKYLSFSCGYTPNNGQVRWLEYENNAAALTLRSVDGAKITYFDKLKELDAIINAYENPYTLTVTDAGWATLFLDYNAQIPDFEGEEAGAYIITGVKEGNWLQLKNVTGVLPANTGILVKADAKEGGYIFNYAATATAKVDGNLLEGTVAATTVEGAAYVLGYAEKTNELVFGQAKLTDGSFLNNANKAYLPASAVPANVALSANLRFDFGGTTGVEEVETEATETVIYDLTGRRVNEITKAGVYIINGKKILVK